MAVSKKMVFFLRASMTMALLCAIALPNCAEAQSLSPSPAPANDGTSVDQGIAYLLMLVALVLTYLIHPLDASSFF
ncbi:hypothetical protein V2J09_024326 [Rumex salicifolius]